MASGTAGDGFWVSFSVDEERGAAPQVNDDQWYTSHQPCNIF
jgi:hypothetical protein